MITPTAVAWVYAAKGLLMYCGALCIFGAIYAAVEAAIRRQRRKARKPVPVWLTQIGK